MIKTKQKIKDMVDLLDLVEWLELDNLLWQCFVWNWEHVADWGC
jgi:hypothetical protein